MASQQERFIAANELADVYKRLLSLDKYRNNTALLQRATSLLKSNKRVGTTALPSPVITSKILWLRSNFWKTIALGM